MYDLLYDVAGIVSNVWMTGY